VFGSRTTVGLVRFYSATTAQNVANVLKTLRSNTHGFSFDAKDISAAPVFGEHSSKPTPAESITSPS